MRGDKIGHEYTEMAHETANDRNGLESRIDAVVMELARIIGRRIARDQYKADFDSKRSQEENIRNK